MEPEDIPICLVQHMEHDHAMGRTLVITQCRPNVPWESDYSLEDIWKGKARTFTLKPCKATCPVCVAKSSWEIMEINIERQFNEDL